MKNFIKDHFWLSFTLLAMTWTLFVFLYLTEFGSLEKQITYTLILFSNIYSVLAYWGERRIYGSWGRWKPFHEVSEFDRLFTTLLWGFLGLLSIYMAVHEGLGYGEWPIFSAGAWTK